MAPVFIGFNEGVDKLFDLSVIKARIYWTCFKFDNDHEQKKRQLNKKSRTALKE